MGIAVEQFLQLFLCRRAALLHGSLDDGIDLLHHFLVGEGFLKLQQGVHVGAQGPGQRTEQGNVGAGGVGLPLADGRGGNPQLCGQLFLGQTFGFAESGDVFADFQLI